MLVRVCLRLFRYHAIILITQVSDMEQYSQRLEPMSQFDQDPQYKPPWHRSAKVKVFSIGAGTVLVLGLLWTLFQPSVYRSNATVLMSAPATFDAVETQADIQKVAIQRAILLGKDITEQLLIKLQGLGFSVVDATYLNDALNVDPLPETNLIEMSAQSADSDMLPTIVNSWIDVYIAMRALDIEQSKTQTEQQVTEELESLAVKIEAARDTLERYRTDNQIVSVKREENDVLARLDGLNRALNNAIEEEVKAKSYLGAVAESIDHGKKVVPSSDQGTVQRVERELKQLRNKLAAVTKRYTQQYISKQPSLRDIPAQIDKLEMELASRLSEGQAVELDSAKRAYAATLGTTEDLRLRLNEHKEYVSRFNRVYATHESLVEDLAGLEALSREMQGRLVQLEVQQVNKYPQVDVIDRSGRSEHIGPDYAVLLGGTALGAVVFGIFCVWLYGFLGHEKKQPAYVTISGVAAYPQNVSGELSHLNKPDPRLAQADARLLRGDQEHPEDTDPPEKAGE